MTKKKKKTENVINVIDCASVYCENRAKKKKKMCAFNLYI